MERQNSLEEYKQLVVGLLRDIERRGAGADKHKLDQLKYVSDDDLLRKWLWLGSIVGGIVFFLAGPFLGGLLARMLPFFIMPILWTVIKMGMGMVVITLGLAIYFTLRKSAS